MRNPYMVRRWASRRRGLQNSPEVRTSTRPVRTASDTISPPPIVFDPLLFEFRQLAKKYVALPLCATSNNVPATTRKIMVATYACITAGGMDAESSANGFTVNIIDLPIGT